MFSAVYFFAGGISPSIVGVIPKCDNKSSATVSATVFLVLPSSVGVKINGVNLTSTGASFVGTFSFVTTGWATSVSPAISGLAFLPNVIWYAKSSATLPLNVLFWPVGVSKLTDTTLPSLSLLIACVGSE